MQAPEEVVGQRFIIAQRNLHTTKIFTDALQKAFPELKIQDGEDGDRSPVIDNTNVRI